MRKSVMKKVIKKNLVHALAFSILLSLLLHSYDTDAKDGLGSTQVTMQRCHFFF